MRRVSVALPPSPPRGAYSLRESMRPPTDSVIRAASAAASMGSVTVMVTHPVVMTERSTVDCPSAEPASWFRVSVAGMGAATPPES